MGMKIPLASSPHPQALSKGHLININPEVVKGLLSSSIFPALQLFQDRRRTKNRICCLLFIPSVPDVLSVLFPFCLKKVFYLLH